MSIPDSLETKKLSDSSSITTNTTAVRKFSIGHILLDMGKITPVEAERILRLQKESGLRFGDAAIKLGLITEADIQLVLAQQFDYPYLLPGQGNHPPELVVAYQPFGAQVEVFRAIRSQLMIRWFTSERKALTIISCNPKEGASLFTANLAVVFSQLGERTLLIDANLRCPQQHEIFNLKNKQGLSDVLVARANVSEVISKIDSFVDLSVLPAGTLPPNPLELLNRSSFDEMNDQLSSQYDVILYDTLAFSNGVDALAIAARTEGALVVAHKNNTCLDDVNAMSEQLKYSGAEIVGSVLIDF
ncbi:chain length determinant protein tyrosine kinase EpsG [Nitrosomonas supralitoralis]|uniref:Chain length determinant protein tyrosine kinase EpsG n=1 Tax=Nitrosomonas supralitoralis TaxID=2116706 RepID=A0A2P7NSJ4_9PROT|nr:chain length determinant protein tyrosine kinase EpsG [Nitrosomonas supralitoralis]PSJ16444.1 chain length determinant protein tyrosine kinase EpsG [Nitrosomonas supralitoralis]